MVSTNKYVKSFLSMTCLKSEPLRACVSRLWPAVSYNTQMLNLTLLPDLMANFPVGGSFKQLMHYFQGYMSKNFRQYDYGREMNWLRYHQLNDTSTDEPYGTLFFQAKMSVLFHATASNRPYSENGAITVNSMLKIAKSSN
uniref:Uncharacterized protein n=1 Tax=Glossina morsitans morsitans TaxID=37546 RepID=A0A1B0G103_GLOMM